MNNDYSLKNVVLFTKNLCKMIYLDVDYDECKNIMLGYKTVITNNEKKAKNIYDSLNYLLAQKENNIDESTIKKWYFILYEKSIDNILTIKIINTIYNLNNETILENIENTIKEIKEFTNDNIICLQWLYYLLYKNGYTTLLLNKNEVFLLQNELNKDNKISKETILKIILTQQVINEPNNRKITKQEIINEILINKNIFKDYLRICHISLFGSFSKDEDTLESDIDLLVSFEDVSSYSQKKSKVSLLKDILEKSLGRQIDVLEISNNIDHNTFYAIKTAIKIY
ncbi:MAG: nucleotidyltransferase domain-containing protein [Erysipelotrichaceae bacterium]|nr:nucleotidyltransferase domain-containing protein [Erysipelotrichaceae bacterium]